MGFCFGFWFLVLFCFPFFFVVVGGGFVVENLEKDHLKKVVLSLLQYMCAEV